METLLKGKFSTFDLLVLRSLDQLLLIMQTLFCFAKEADFMRRSTVWSLPLPLAFPA